MFSVVSELSMLMKTSETLSISDVSIYFVGRDNSRFTSPLAG